MQTARRLYLYTISGISLAVLLIGAHLLLRLMLVSLGLPSGIPPDVAPVVTETEQQVRRELATGWAMVGVGLPVWVIHWFVAGRLVAREEAERGSTVRAIYLTLVLLVLLAVGISGASGMLRSLIQPLAGAATDNFRDVAGDLARLLIGGSAWAYHVVARLSDLRRGPLHGPAAWWPRVYLYAAAAGGLIAVLTAAAELVRLSLEAVLDAPDPFADEFRADRLASSIAQVVVGAIVWGGHWSYVARLRRGPEWRGDSERPARLRLAYFVAVIGLSAAGVVILGGQALSALLAVPLGASGPVGSNAPDVLLAFGVAVLVAAPFALAWRLHLGWVRAESAELSPERAATADRLDLYAVSVVGLAAAGVGVGWLLGLGIDLVAGGERLAEPGTRDQLAAMLPTALLGGGLLAWKWDGIRRRYAAAPPEEARSTTRRTWLLLILGGSVVALLGSLGTLLYRLFAELFGVAAPADAADLSTPAGAMIVATGLLVASGLLLRRDQELLAAQPSTAEPSPAEPPRAEPPPPEAPTAPIEPGQPAEASELAEPIEVSPPALAERRSAPRPTAGVVAWVGRPVIFAGDAPVMRLYRSGDTELLAAVAHLRAAWTDDGAGNALFTWLAPEAEGPWAGPVVFTDATKMAKNLAARIVRHLPELAGLDLDEAHIESATFATRDDLRVGYRVECQVKEHRVVATWSDLRDRRIIQVPGFVLGTERMDLTTLIAPCGAAELVVDGQRIDGEVRSAAGDDRSQSSAYVAIGTAWSSPEQLMVPVVRH